MIYRGKKIAFPAQTRISFSKLIDRLKHKAATGLKNSAETDALLEACKLNESLINGFVEGDFNSKNEIIIQLCSTLFPEVLRNNEIKGVIPPFEFRPFYVSDRFERILNDSGTDFCFELNNFDEDQVYMYGCNSILHFYYGYPFLMALPNLVNISMGNGKGEKTYRLVMNGDLLEIEPAGKVNEFTQEDWLELLNDYENIELWKQKFPPDSWIMKGIGIVTLIDVTSDQTIANLTSRLLTSPLKNLNEIADDLGNFLGVDNLEMGFLDHDNQSFSSGLSGFKSVILEERASLSFKQNLCEPSYKKLIVEEKPIIITDVEKWNTSASCSTVSILVEKASAGSYMLMPVKHHDELLGYLELASATPFKLNGASLLKVNVLLPTLGMAIKRSRNEFQNKVEALIQQKCTTIHPSVKWRFEEESILYMNRLEELEEDIEFNNIIFPEVYPLYGQLDISSSSRKRNEAVQADMLKQLNLVDELLHKIWNINITPIQEEMLYRLHNFQNELQVSLYSGSEQSITYFLINEVHPILVNEQKRLGSTNKEVENYFLMLHPEMQTLYEKRRLFDKHVSVVNQTLANRLDKKQVKAQQMFPHYFERYKTDGVEYNMYIGQSIARSNEFSRINLQNLQLWQLMITCELEQEYHRIKNRFSLDLEIASLILVYSTPITIHFRMDEKIFDVDGAYNARYEIIKKRIDKALIKGTEERLTCPGKIAIIYSNDQDTVFYERYISFLESKGLLLKNATEILEVEDLQGISGLKAFRVSIDYSTS